MRIGKTWLLISHSCKSNPIQKKIIPFRIGYILPIYLSLYCLPSGTKAFSKSILLPDFGQVSKFPFTSVMQHGWLSLCCVSQDTACSIEMSLCWRKIRPFAVICVGCCNCSMKKPAFDSNGTYTSQYGWLLYVEKCLWTPDHRTHTALLDIS